MRAQLRGIHERLLMYTFLIGKYYVEAPSSSVEQERSAVMAMPNKQLPWSGASSHTDME